MSHRDHRASTCPCKWHDAGSTLVLKELPAHHFRRSCDGLLRSAKRGWRGDPTIGEMPYGNLRRNHLPRPGAPHRQKRGAAGVSGCGGLTLPYDQLAHHFANLCRDQHRIDARNEGAIARQLVLLEMAQNGLLNVPGGMSQMHNGLLCLLQGVDGHEMFRRVAGAPGFEPGNGGTKNRCLTAWRRPIMGRELAAMPAECNRQSKRGRLSGRVACAAASAWLAGLARFASCAICVCAICVLSICVLRRYRAGAICAHPLETRHGGALLGAVSECGSAW